MKKKTLKKWLKALRSGEYDQGKDYLKVDNCFCCLGVLCDITGKGQWDKEDAYATEKSLGIYYLPKDLAKEFDMPEEGLHIPKKYIANKSKIPKVDAFRKKTSFSLSTLNDLGYTFEEIADMIERYYDLLD